MDIAYLNFPLIVLHPFGENTQTFAEHEDPEAQIAPDVQGRFGSQLDDLVDAMRNVGARTHGQRGFPTRGPDPR